MLDNDPDLSICAQVVMGLHVQPHGIVSYQYGKVNKRFAESATKQLKLFYTTCIRKHLFPTANYLHEAPSCA